jgi:hypothetical protein
LFDNQRAERAPQDEASREVAHEDVLSQAPTPQFIGARPGGTIPPPATSNEQRRTSASDLAFRDGPGMLEGGSTADGDIQGGASMGTEKQLVRRELLAEVARLRGTHPNWPAVDALEDRARAAYKNTPGLDKYLWSIRVLGMMRDLTSTENDAQWDEHVRMWPGALQEASVFISPAEKRALEKTYAEILASRDRATTPRRIASGELETTEIYDERREAEKTARRRDELRHDAEVREFYERAANDLARGKAVEAYDRKINGAYHAGGMVETSVHHILRGTHALEAAMKNKADSREKQQAMAAAMEDIETGLQIAGGQDMVAFLSAGRATFHSTVTRIAAVAGALGPWGLALSTVMKTGAAIDKYQAGELTGTQFWMKMFWNATSLVFKDKIGGSGSYFAQSFRSAVTSGGADFAVDVVGVLQGEGTPEQKAAKIEAAMKSAIAGILVDTLVGSITKHANGVEDEFTRKVVKDATDISKELGLNWVEVKGKSVQEWIADLGNP